MAKRKPVNKAAAADAKPVLPKIKIMRYAVFSMKNGQSVKTPIDGDETGRSILKDCFVTISTGKPYLNEERGILINPVELSHAYLTMEQVQ